MYKTPKSLRCNISELYFNPYMPNGLFHHCKLDELISHLTASDLGLHCLPTSARHKWVTVNILKIWIPEKFAVITLKFPHGGFNWASDLTMAPAWSFQLSWPRPDDLSLVGPTRVQLLDFCCSSVSELVSCLVLVLFHLSDKSWFICLLFWFIHHWWVEVLHMDQTTSMCIWNELQLNLGWGCCRVKPN